MASTTTAAATASSTPMTPQEKAEALTLFVELLRFPTISFAGPTNGSYRACAQWLVKTLSDLGLETQVRREGMVQGACVCRVVECATAKPKSITISCFLHPRPDTQAPPLLPFDFDFHAPTIPP